MGELTDLSERPATRVDDGVCLQPCADIVFYWAGTPFERADGLLALFAKAADIVGQGWTFYCNETMGAAKRTKKDTKALLESWLESGPQAGRDPCMLALESGAVADEPSDRASRSTPCLAMAASA